MCTHHSRSLNPPFNVNSKTDVHETRTYTHIQFRYEYHERVSVTCSGIHPVGYYFPSSFPQKSRSVVADHSLVRDTQIQVYVQWLIHVHKLMVGNTGRIYVHLYVHPASLLSLSLHSSENTHVRVFSRDHEIHIDIDSFTSPCIISCIAIVCKYIKLFFRPVIVYCTIWWLSYGSLWFRCSSIKPTF